MVHLVLGVVQLGLLLGLVVLVGHGRQVLVVEVVWVLLTVQPHLGHGQQVLVVEEVVEEMGLMVLVVLGGHHPALVRAVLVVNTAGDGGDGHLSKAPHLLGYLGLVGVQDYVCWALPVGSGLTPGL